MKKFFIIIWLCTVFVSNAQNTLNLIGLGTDTRASVAYSLRKLSNSYTGPLVRIKVGTSFYDVYPDLSTNKFSLNSKISASISTYNAAVSAAGSNALSSIITAGSTNATVAIWYDQSGNGVHVLSNSSIPNAKIITAGSIQTLNGQPTIYFTGSDSKLGSSNTVDYSALSGATVNAVAQNIATTSGYSGIIGTANAGTYPGYNISYTSGVGYQSDGDGCGYRTSVNSIDPKIVTNIFINNTTNLSKIYINNELKTNVAVTSGTCALSHISGSKIFIGVSRGFGSTSTFIGNISEAFIFPKQMSAGDQTLLETSQTEYYFSPNVTITSSASGAVCAGTSVTFTATPYNFTGTPTYQWYKNSAVISGATSSTYSSTSLTNGDQVYVRVEGMASNGAIVTNGLRFNLDAGNTASYSGTGTTWTDLSGNGHHGTLSGATLPVYSSDNGGCFVFNGLTSNVNLNKNALAIGIYDNSYTAEAWVYPTDLDGNRGMFGDEQTGTRQGLHLNFVDGYIHQGHYSSDADIGSVSINSWYQIVFTFDKSTGATRMYKNGVDQGNSVAILSYIGNSSIHLGQSYGNTGFFKGKGAVYKMYNRVLSSAELTTNYNALRSRFSLTGIVSVVNSASITTIVNAGPTTPVITITGDACVNKTSLTTPNGLISYAWYKDNVLISGATSNSFSPIAAGEYKVEVSNGTCSTNSAATTINTCGVSASGKMISTAIPATLVSSAGGANYGTTMDYNGKIQNTTVVTTTTGTIGITTASISAAITAKNATSIGVVYSTDANFGTSTTNTIQSNVVAGTYTANLTGLAASTTYYAKSFIVNKAGTFYGSVVNFTTSTPPKAVGDYYGDGIIFYILKSTDPGYDANVQHGLIGKIASSTSGSTAPGGTNGELIAMDPGSGWTSNGLTTFTGATGDALFAGKSNTTTIISVLGTTSAAYSCYNYRSKNYNDWYMPSSWELDILLYYHMTRMSAGGSRLYTAGDYISSTDKNQASFKTYYSESRGSWDGPQNDKATQRSRGLIPIRSF